MLVHSSVFYVHALSLYGGGGGGVIRLRAADGLDPRLLFNGH